MTKTQAKEKAKDIIAETIGVANYKLENEIGLSENDIELISMYINKFANTACKAIGRDYIAY